MDIRDVIDKVNDAESRGEVPELTEEEADLYSRFDDESLAAYNKRKNRQPLSAREESLADIYEENLPFEKLRLLQKGSRIAKEGIGHIRRPLDWLGGVGRVGLTQLIDELTPKEREVAGPADQGVKVRKSYVTEQDWMDALKGQAPGGKTLLRRMGDKNRGNLSDVLPELYSETGKEWLKFQKGGPLDPSEQGLRGWALENISDPLTYGTFGVVPALRTTWAQMLTRPGRTLANKAAYPIYRRGLKYADKAQMAVDPVYRGATPSEALFGEELAGSATKIDRGVGEAVDSISRRRKPIQDAAEAKGYRARPKQYLREAYSVAHDMQNPYNPSQVRQAGSELEDILEEISDLGPTKASDTDRIAREYGKLARNTNVAMPGSAYGVAPDVSPMKEGYQAISKGARDAHGDLMEKGTPGGKAMHKELNQKLAALANARRAIAQGAATELGKFDLTSVDGLLGSAAIMSKQDPLTAALALSAKKAADLQKTTWFNTKTGVGLKRQGENPVPTLDWIVRGILRGASAKPDIYSLY